MGVYLAMEVKVCRDPGTDSQLPERTKTMKNSRKLVMLAFALVLFMSPRAHAFGGRGWNPPPPPPPPPPPHGPGCNTAPEVDPGLALGGFTLLGGSLTVMRSRRRK
jgi:hypothetical protein